MAIAIIQEPKKWQHEPAENCCFCRSRTRTWSKDKDVAVCEGCAEKHDESEVPSKKDWFEREQALMRQENLGRYASMRRS